MEFTCVQADLKAALDIVKRQAPSKTTLAALGGVLIKADDAISLTTTDLTAFVIKKMAAKVKEEGTLLIPVALLSEFVSSLPDEPITIVSKKQDAIVTCGRFRSTIKGLLPEDYPEIPKVATTLEIDADVLKGIISRVAFAAAKDDARPTLGGVFLESHGDGLRVTAADGFRLAAGVVPIVAEGLNIIVPAKSIKDAVRLIIGTVRVGTDNSSIRFESDGVVFGTRLIEGQYPNIDRIVPKPDDAKTTVTVDTGELMRAIKEKKLDVSEIDVSVSRILRAKGGCEVSRTLTKWVANPCPNSSYITEMSITLIKKRGITLPIPRKTPLILAGDSESFETSPLRDYFRVIDPRVIDPAKANKTDDIEYKTVIFAIFTNIKAWKGISEISNEERKLISKLMRKVKNSIVISFGSPYVLRDFGKADMLVAAYEATEQAQNAVIRCLKGEMDFKGRMPIHAV